MKKMKVDLFINTSYDGAELITKTYSTSFSLATSLLSKEQRKAIYAIYGFVRVADEIVDSFHNYDRAALLEKLHNDLHHTMEYGISPNPVLTAFADTVKTYHIDSKHIQAFMDSMKQDLFQSEYNNSHDLDNYIYGSANVVGLMCLKVFTNGNQTEYERLQEPAEKLGSAFQKINFIRDIKDDMHELGRNYFPEIALDDLNDDTKKKIEQSTEKDFKAAYPGIRQLPGRSKLAVALAYYYYHGLFKKIQRTSPEVLLSKRMRLSNFRKQLIIIKVWVLYKLNQI
jgi:phytoene/squalene synthetase